MTEADRSDFNAALDALAKALGQVNRDDETKTNYFKALSRYPFDLLLHAMNWLGGNFTPTRFQLFPVPATIAQRIDSEAQARPPEKPYTNYEEIQADYKRRGFVIGEEARTKLEVEANRKRDI